MSFSFPKLRKVSGIISLKKLSSHFSLSYSEFPIMRILVYLLVSYESLKLYSPIFFYFFSPLIWWVPLLCLWVFWSFLLLHLVLYWTPLEFFRSVFVLFRSVISVWYLYFLFVQNFALFIHSSPDIDEHIYDHYFELFIG